MTDRITPLPWKRQFTGKLAGSNGASSYNSFLRQGAVTEADEANGEIGLVSLADYTKLGAINAELVEMLDTVLESYRVSVSPEESFIKKALIQDTKLLIQKAKGGGNG